LTLCKEKFTLLEDSIKRCDVNNTELYKSFITRLNLAETKYSKKFRRIKESRQVAKLELVNDVTDDGQKWGNDRNREKEGTRSRYQSTIFKAIGDSILTDITSRPMRFEWGGNDNEGLKMKRAYDLELTRSYAYSETDKAKIITLNDLIYSSCSIIQPYSEIPRKEFLNPKTGKVEIFPSSRIVSYRAYDPLTTILDWNSNPADVTNTSQFAIVYIGLFRKDELTKRYGAEAVSELPDELDDQSTNFGTNILVRNKRELEENAGTSNLGGFHLYEYYLTDGYRYTIIEGYGVIDKSPNSSGAFGKIPLLVTPLFIDRDTPYGMSLYETLQQAIDLVNASINQIADVNARSIKSPTFALKGLLATDELSLTDTNATDIKELDVNAIMVNGGNNIPSVQDLIGRIEWREVTDGAMFLMKNGLEHIWMLTGKNPTALGGIQDKQIRVAGASNMMQQGALRSSSIIANALETYFLNPLTQSFAEMFAIYYDDFPALKGNGITREMAMNIPKHIRVVNGSYLPADQYNEMQRTDALLQYMLTTQTQGIDAVAVFREWMSARGEPLPERFLVDPMTTLAYSQLVSVLQMADQIGADKTMAQLQQRAEQMNEQR